MQNHSSIARNIIACLIVSGVSACRLSAQVPQKMSFQSVIRNASGELVIDKQVGIRISIMKGPLPGTLVYQETKTPVTSKNGIVTLEFGSEPGFDAIKWGNDEHYIKTDTDPDGGTNYIISSASRILSVPYTIIANKAQTVSGRFCYSDKDGDGFGDVYSPLWIPLDVNIPEGYVLNGEDCNDTDQYVHPGAAEICGDGTDQDCDGLVDENC